MAIEEGIRTLLLAESTVSTLLGEATKGVYVDHAPQNAVLPYVEIHNTSMNPMLHLGTTGGMRSSELDIDCKAATGEAARALADAVEAYIDDYSGAAGSDTINAILLQDRVRDVEPPDGARANPRYVQTIDIQCQWTPA